MPLGGGHVLRFKAISTRSRDTGVLDRIHHTSSRSLPGAKGREAPRARPAVGSAISGLFLSSRLQN